MLIEHVDKTTLRIVNDEGQERQWSVPVFSRTRYSDVVDAFRDINGYWAGLNANRRRRIFDIYKEARELITEYNSFEGVDNIAMDTGVLTASLIKIVERLYKEMPLEEIEKWLRLYGGVVYPNTGLRTEHDPDDPMPDRTYLVKDYTKLVLLTTALRAMVPIWGEYISIIEKTTGTLYKEYIALRLLSRSSIIEYDAFDRLRRYIECSITRDTDTTAAVLSGLSTREIPEWLLAVVIVRRISVGEVDASEDSGNIITNIYGFVTSTLKDLNKKFGGIKEKWAATTSDDGEEGSKLETYRPRQTISTGDTMLFNIGAEDVENLVYKIDPSVPDAMIDKYIKASNKLHNLQVAKAQMDICAWVLGDLPKQVLSPNAVESLHQTALIGALVATQILLAHWGFFELSVLITAEGRVPNSNEATLISSQKAIPSSTIDRLNYHYPYTISTGPSSRKPNTAYSAINTVTQEFIILNWYCNLPDSIVNNQNVRLEPSKRIKISDRLKDSLASLVVYLNDRHEVM